MNSISSGHLKYFPVFLVKLTHVLKTLLNKLHRWSYFQKNLTAIVSRSTHKSHSQQNMEDLTIRDLSSKLKAMNKKVADNFRVVFVFWVVVKSKHVRGFFCVFFCSPGVKQNNIPWSSIFFGIIKNHLWLWFWWKTHTHTHTWHFCLWPFWDGEKVTPFRG